MKLDAPARALRFKPQDMRSQIAYSPFPKHSLCLGFDLIHPLPQLLSAVPPVKSIPILQVPLPVSAPQEIFKTSLNS